MSTLSFETSKSNSSDDIIFCECILENTYFESEVTVNLVDELWQEMFRDSYNKYKMMLYEQKIVTKIEKCCLEIAKIIKDLYDFPISYNQLLLQGSLNYCEIALKEMKKKAVDDSKSKAFQNTQQYVLDVKGLYYQHEETDKMAIGLSKMDLQIFEDQFDTIQKLYHEEGILPPLDEMTLKKYPR